MVANAGPRSAPHREDRFDNKSRSTGSNDVFAVSNEGAHGIPGFKNNVEDDAETYGDVLLHQRRPSMA